MKVINSIWFRCKACDKELIPHLVKIHLDPETEGLMWENLCPECRSKVPRWNAASEQWNNDDSSLRFNSNPMGDALGELLGTLHNGGSTGGSFNSQG